MTEAAVDSSYFDDRIARRNAYILAVAMTLSSCSAIIVFSVASIVGTQLSPSPALVTLPVSTFVIGTALTTVPASFLMGLIGRRPGFMIGAATAFAGAMLAIWALFHRDFVVFCAGTFLLGSYQAFSQYYRFAAADRATDEFKSKVISWVLVGGVGGSVLGPFLVIYSKELLSPVLFAGTFVVSAVLALCAFALLSLVDIPKVNVGEDNRPTRPLGVILRQPRLIVAIIAGMAAYGVMNLLMTATPIAMLGCGFNVDDSTLVIQWHSLAMFLPSFFTGHLIARFGVERIIGLGMAILLGSALVAMAGLSFTHFSAGLILLGLGWNFGFVGATTMVTSCYEPAEKAKVQAVNDFAVFGTVAIASLTSGVLYSYAGWHVVNMALFPMVGVSLLALAWLFWHARRSAA